MEDVLRRLRKLQHDIDASHSRNTQKFTQIRQKRQEFEDRINKALADLTTRVEEMEE